MSAASSARSQIRDAAPAVSSPRASQAAAAGKSGNSGFAFAGADSDDDFRLNLSDIPRVPYTMEVEGLKPSLLGRLVGMVIGSR